MNDRKDRDHKTLLERFEQTVALGLFFVLAPFGIAEEVIARVKSRLLWWRR